MPKLKGTKTQQNLKDAFAGESQANRRYLYSRRRPTWKATTTSPSCSARPPKARPATPMATSILEEVGDPATGLPIGPPRQPQGRHRRRDARIHRHVPGMARTAREEGFEEIADGSRPSRRPRSPRRPLPAGLDEVKNA